MSTRDVVTKVKADNAERTLEAAGRLGLRSALAVNLLWIGGLKFFEYEAEGIQPMVSTSPFFSWINNKLGTRKIANLIGVTEIVLGTLIAAGPRSPKASALGSLGATAMFLTTLSFLGSMPGVSQGDYRFPALSLEGQFLLKDTVLLGAALLTAAESLRASHQSS